jgi:hypothetical protein
MSDERPKRRLELMPEVLPAPRLDGDPGSPRARTVNHMRRMMTTVAAVVGVDPMPRPSRGCGCTKRGYDD